MNKKSVIFIFLLFLSISSPAFAQSDSIVIWSEDFTGFDDNAVPQKGKNAEYINEYSSYGSANVIYVSNPISVSPELRIPRTFDNSQRQKNNYFIVKIPLYGAYGKFTLSFKCNKASNITVERLSGKRYYPLDKVYENSTGAEYSVNVSKDANSLQLRFTNTSTGSINVDDFLLLAPSDSRSDKPFPELNFQENTLTTYLGEDFSAPILDNPQSLPVTYWSSDKTIATVDGNGNVKLKSLGNATISAIFTGNDNYCYKEVSYQLHVDRRVPDDEVYYEGFNKILAKGSNDDFSYSGLVNDFDNPCSKGINIYGSYKSIFLNQGVGNVSSFTVGPINSFKGGDVVVSFKVGKYGKGDIQGTLTASNGKSKTDSLFTVKSKKWTTYSIPFCDLQPSATFTFKGNEIYIDSISVRAIPKSISVSIGNAGYSTLYYGNYALEVPKDVDAYTMKVDGDNIVSSHRYTAGDIIPKATGVIVMADKGAYTLNVSYQEGVVDADNELRGTDYKQLTTDGNVYYMLAPYNGEVGFYWAAQDGAAFLNGAHKAYLALSSEESQKAKSGYTFHIGDVSTNINAEAVSANPDGADYDCYNIIGQKVNGSSYKGIAIKKGKKIILR